MLSLTKTNLRWSRSNPLTGWRVSCSVSLVLTCWGRVPLLFPPLATVVQVLSVPVLGAALAAAAYNIPPAGRGAWVGFFLMSGATKFLALGSDPLGGLALGGCGGGGGGGGSCGCCCFFLLFVVWLARWVSRSILSVSSTMAAQSISSSSGDVICVDP